jgi:hypothetical protein
VITPNPTNIELGIWDDVDYSFPESSKKLVTTVIPSYQIPGLIQLKGDIYINSQLWSFYNLENLKVIYKAGYGTIPYDLELCATKLAALEFARSKGLIAAIEWEKDPAKMHQDAWDEVSQYRRER